MGHLLLLFCNQPHVGKVQHECQLCRALADHVEEGLERQHLVILWVAQHYPLVNQILIKPLQATLPGIVVALPAIAMT